MCHTQEELDAALRAVATLGDQFVIEELLEGEELSVFAIVDGRNVLALPESRDYSRVGDGDTGPNTGGMGSYSPVPELDEGRVAELVETIHRPVVEALAERDTPFIGCLYAGLMLTADGPRMLVFRPHDVAFREEGVGGIAGFVISELRHGPTRRLAIEVGLLRHRIEIDVAADTAPKKGNRVVILPNRWRLFQPREFQV